MNMATFFDQTKWYSTIKGSFRWPTSNSMKKLLRKFKIDKFKDKPLKGGPCTLYIL